MCSLPFFKIAALSSSSVLSLALSLALLSAFGDGLLWGFRVFRIGFAAFLVAMRRPIRIFIHVYHASLL